MAVLSDYVVSLRFLNLNDPVLICELWKKKEGELYENIVHSGIRQSDTSKIEIEISSSTNETKLYADLHGQYMTKEFSTEQAALTYINSLKGSMAEGIFESKYPQKGRPLRL